MAFVKLDCGILDSTIWLDREAREVFVTALLMALPIEVTEPMKALEIGSTTESGFIVPAGWYGFVRAAGPGIVNRSGVPMQPGMEALKRLSSPEGESRTPDHEGRRMVRVDGGFIILNFDKYREKDHTSAERSRRYRERKLKERHAVTTRSVTQAEVRSQKSEALLSPSEKDNAASPLPDCKEEKKEKPRPKTDPVEVPQSLQGSAEFLSVWGAWLDYLRQKGKRATSYTQKLQLSDLESMGPTRAIAAINNSISGGWQKPYEPKNGMNNNNRNHVPRPDPKGAF